MVCVTLFCVSLWPCVGPPFGSLH